MKRTTLLIYAKPPRIGLAKTRLAKDLGGTESRRIAHFTMARTFNAARAEDGWGTRLYVSPDRAKHESVGGIWPAHIPRFSQGKGTLTHRLQRGLDEAPIGPVLFIGCDAPDLSSALLRGAIRTLQNNDAVFGPARDGGFWLFGINKTARTKSPFKGVRWSGPHAMEDVWSNLPEHAHVALLPMLIDIDDANDWKSWCEWHKRHPHTHLEKAL